MPLYYILTVRRLCRNGSQRSCQARTSYAVSNVPSKLVLLEKGVYKICLDTILDRPVCTNHFVPLLLCFVSAYQPTLTQLMGCRNKKHKKESIGENGEDSSATKGELQLETIVKEESASAGEDAHVNDEPCL
jgi:hypothetical protein